MVRPAWPKLGIIPDSHYEHATQIIADSTKLIGEDATTHEGPKRSVPLHVLLPYVRSCLEFAKKAREQPSMKEMMVAMQTMQADLSATKSSISVIKNTIDTISVDPPSSGSSPTSRKTYRDVVATWATLASQQAGSPLPGSVPSSTQSLLSQDKDREILIKLHDPDKASELRSQRPAELKEHINTAISNSSNPHVRTIRVIAAKQLKSGDISTHAAQPEDCEILKEFAGDWTTALGPKTEIPIATDGVIMHGIHTDLIDMSCPEEAIHSLKV
jgi:hypothetical protein